MIRPAALHLLRRWAEVALAAQAALLGLWLAAKGGYVLLPLGLGLAALALAYGMAAHRRMRFAQSTAAPGLIPGLIEVTEGQIAYFADQGGGFIALPDLVELRLITLQRRRYWRLKQQDGQALLIPVDAAQNAALFDAFCTLPQIDSAALIAALSTPPQTDSATQTLWRRATP
jgi:hypothetical protein